MQGMLVHVLLAVAVAYLVRQVLVARRRRRQGGCCCEGSRSTCGSASMPADGTRRPVELRVSGREATGR